MVECGDRRATARRSRVASPADRAPPRATRQTFVKAETERWRIFRTTTCSRSSRRRATPAGADVGAREASKRCAGSPPSPSAPAYLARSSSPAWSARSNSSLIALTGVAVYFALCRAQRRPRSPAISPVIVAVAALSIVVFQSLHVYTSAGVPPSGARSCSRIAGGWALVFLVVFAAMFFLKLDGVVSRVWMAGWFVARLRRAGDRARDRSRGSSFELARAGRLQQRAVVVGGGEIGADLLRDLAKSDEVRKSRMLGVFDDRSDERSPQTVEGYPKLGNVDDLVDFARSTRIDLVIFALPITAEQRILQMLRKLWVLPIDIRLAAHANRLRFRPRSYSYVGKVPVLDLFDKPIADWDVVIKLAFDKIVGALALIALSPVLLATAIAIKLDSPGPVLFKQKRYGFNNELIEVFKFRSMYADKLDADGRQAGDARRSARDARRPLHPQDLDRRIAATVQRRLQGRSVAGRPAPARGARQGGRPAI